MPRAEVSDDGKFLLITVSESTAPTNKLYIKALDTDQVGVCMELLVDVCVCVCARALACVRACVRFFVRLLVCLPACLHFYEACACTCATHIHTHRCISDHQASGQF